LRCEFVSVASQMPRLSGLGSPPASRAISADEALTFPAVQLFVAHVASKLGEFELRDRDAPIVGGICRSLDGLPLAIEMATARIEAYVHCPTAVTEPLR
jgi:predicted ATPase